MTRRSLFLAFLSPRREYDELRERTLAHEIPYDKFLRKLFGCKPTGPTDAENCNPTLGDIDYAAFRKAREAAKKLYDLADPR
jgi:hypothetical protein